MQQDKEYLSVDLLKLVDGLVRRVWIIVAAIFVCGAIGFSCAAFIVTPLYNSNVMMYVNNSSFSVGSTNFSISSSEITAAKSLVDTYLVILKTRTTLNEVIQKGNLDYTYEELRGMIKAQAVNETEVFSVTVTSKDPREAEHIANTIAVVLPDKIANVVEGSSVRIVDYAVVPSEKAFPSIRKYTMVGMALGLLFSCAAVIIIEILDDQIRGEEYLLKNYEGIPLLAVVPDMMEEKSGKYEAYYRQTTTNAGRNAAQRRKAK